MRNLKRVLGLALASVMVLSMMVIGAGAASYDDFSDKDKIVNKEAVQMLVELGVINGKDTGDFDPTGIVTRAEMAKMICVVLNGGKDPSLGTTVTNSYTDTVGHWAAAYIEYCSNLGIVAGDGTGNFNPNATVTGSEAAKMLLVAAGYQSAIEGFTGANWAIGVNVRANQKGLYSDLSISVDAGLTRDSAAQMVYNALDATVVSYTYTLVTDGSSLSSSPTLKDDSKTTLLEDKFNAVKVEGVVVANEYANLSATSVTGSALDEGKTKIVITNDDDQSAYAGTETFAVSTGADGLGRSVAIYVKKNSNAAKAEVLGSAITSADNVVVKDTSDDSIADVADDNDLTFDANAKVAYNYGGLVALTKEVRDADQKNGIEKFVIDVDDDGDVDYVLVNTMYFGKVSKYSTKDDGSITIDVNKAWTNADGDASNLSADDSADVAGFDDVAEGDYVMAGWIGGKLYVSVADSVTGVLDSIKANDSLTVDGTKYDVSLVPGFTAGTDEIVAASSVGSTYLDNEATFYLDKNGMIVAVGNVAENAYDFAYLWAYDAGDQLDDARAKVTLSDGTTKTYTVDKVVDKNGDKLATVAEKTIYAYSINSDGELKLTQANVSDKTTGYDFTKGNTKVNTSLYATNNTVFFYVSLKDGKVDDVDVYTGYKNAPSVTGTIGGNAVVSNGSATTVTAVAFEGATVATKDVSDHLYITDVLSASSKYTEVKAILAGTDEETTIKVDTDDLVPVKVGDKMNDGEDLYLFTVGDDDIYTLSKDFDSKNLTADFGHISDSTMVIGSGEYKLTDKTVVLDLTDGDVNATLGVLPTSDDTVVSALVSDTDDGDLLMIVIDNTEEKTEEPETPSSEFTGTNVAVVDNNAGTVTLKYHGTKPAAPAAVALVKAADANIKSVDTTNYASDKLSVTTVSGDTYKLAVVAEEYFLVKYNGAEIGYFKTTDKDFELASKASAIINTEDATAASAYTTVSSDKFTVDVSALTADLNLKDAAKITAQTNASAATFGTTSEATGITAGTTYVAAGTKVYVMASENDKAITAGQGAPTLTEEVAPSASAKGVYSFTMPATDVAAEAFTQAS